VNVLVTGITGRIGANLAASLAALGHSVRGLVWPRDPAVSKLADLEIEFVSGSLTDCSVVNEAVDGVDAIYHLGAAFQGGGPFSEEEYFEINVGGTFNVLEAARRQVRPPHVFFASTDAIYEKYVPGGLDAPITEETPRVPRGAYAVTKSVAEELCAGYWHTYSLPVTILRFANVMAADEILGFPQFYLSKMHERDPVLARLWTGEEQLLLLMDSNGRYYKKHVADVRDIVHGCLCALGKEGACGETFQLAGPKPFTWDEAVYRLSEILKIPAVEAAPAGNPTFYEFDLSKAQRYLGFQPQFDVVRMIVDGLGYQRGEDIGVRR